MLKKINSIQRRLNEIADVFGVESMEYGKQKALVEGFLDSAVKNTNLWKMDKNSGRIRIDKKAISQFSEFETDIEDALNYIKQGQKNLGTALQQAKAYSGEKISIRTKRDIMYKGNIKKLKEMAYVGVMAKKVSTDYYAMINQIDDDDLREDILEKFYIMGKMRRTDAKEEMYDELVMEITAAIAGVQKKSIEHHENTSKGGRASTDLLPY